MIYVTQYRTTSTTETTVIDDIPYPQRVHMMPKYFRRHKSGMYYPPHKLLESLLDDELVSYIRDTPVKGKTGFLFAAGSQNWAGVNGRYDQNPDAFLHYKVNLPFVTLTNIYAGRLASMLGGADYVATDASACASSLKVLMDAQNLMWMYGYDRIIVATVEDSINNNTLEFFGDAGANLLLADEAERQPSAFDSKNSGFLVGQGAAIFVLEKEHSGIANPHAKFLGAYAGGEANNNPLGQREDGAGFSHAIEGALSVAKVDKSAVRLVKTHGTGTPVNNVAEKTALLRSLDEFVATSYKPRIGHTVAASGLLETGLLLDDIKSGYVPKILNRTEDDTVFLSEDTPVPDGLILSLAAGMGNIFAASLFSTEV